MQAVPGRTNGWWISPAIPAIANGVLALLWLMSGFGGWGDTAFCGESGELDATCVDRFTVAVIASVFPAALAAALAVTACTAPAVRRRRDRLDAFLTIAALLWVVAEAILFVGGFLAKP